MTLRPRCLYTCRTLAICLVVLIYYFLYQSNGFLQHQVDALSSRGKLDEDILNSTLGFEKVFVLNLPSRTDRRDALTLAAQLSGIHVTWIDGISGDEVSDHALPPGERTGLSIGGKGSWRAHMNVIRRIVEDDLDSALILEDDIDWDVRLKLQLQSFAQASQALLSDKVRKRVRNANTDSEVNQKEEDLKDYERISFPLDSDVVSNKVTRSPYGDNWDVTWLGHCGTAFRTKSPISRIIIHDDDTVPEPQYLRPHPLASLDSYGKVYPPHTRIVHHPQGSSCPLAYALTKTGAQKLLYEFGVKSFDKQMDFMLGDFCDNDENANGTGLGRVESEGVCVTVQPPLFSHHYPAGARSDIYTSGLVSMKGTPYVRWSVRLNLARLIKGSKWFSDQWPDSAPEQV